MDLLLIARNLEQKYSGRPRNVRLDRESIAKCPFHAAIRISGGPTKCKHDPKDRQP
jgi:hypothetical protein